MQLHVFGLHEQMLIVMLNLRDVRHVLFYVSVFKCVICQYI
uniref:Uncharacterized protein n=1 Tax=Anguilla anguilla TaxID=7936 RepID=A0A0E9VAI5_ANGAN